MLGGGIAGVICDGLGRRDGIRDRKRSAWENIFRLENLPRRRSKKIIFQGKIHRKNIFFGVKGRLT